MTRQVKGTVDRIEESWLVCYTDDGILCHLPVADYPTLKGGERVWLTMEDEEATALVVDTEETEKCRQKSKSLFAALLRKKRK